MHGRGNECVRMHVGGAPSTPVTSPSLPLCFLAPVFTALLCADQRSRSTSANIISHCSRIRAHLLRIRCAFVAHSAYGPSSCITAHSSRFAIHVHSRVSTCIHEHPNTCSIGAGRGTAGMSHCSRIRVHLRASHACSSAFRRVIMLAKRM